VAVQRGAQARGEDVGEGLAVGAVAGTGERQGVPRVVQAGSLVGVVGKPRVIAV